MDASIDAASDASRDATDRVRVEEDYLIVIDAGIDAQDADTDGSIFDADYSGDASRCGSDAHVICEGFENGTWDSLVWSPIETSGTLSVDATHVARGTRALHIRTVTDTDGGSGANVGLSTTRGLPFAANVIWGRAFVWLAPASAPMATASMFQSTGPLTVTGRVITVSQRLSIGSGHLGASYDNSPQPPFTDYGLESATPMPVSRWACLEWEFKGSTNEAHYYLNAMELTDIAVLPTADPQWIAPPWSTIQVGLQFHGSDAINAIDVWIDEVAIDTTRIGCDD